MTTVSLSPPRFGTPTWLPGGRRRSTPTEEVSELLVGAIPQSVARARHWVTDQLRAVGASADAASTAELLSSELVTNAVRHGRTGGIITVLVRRDGDTAVVSVRDEGEALPCPGTPEVEDVSGRGLPLVAALAADWGVTPHVTGGKSVWFRLDLAA